MTNHVHLIGDPGDDTESLALMMKGAAARQTRYVNRLERRTGTLWEGRYRSSIICKDNYLMACCRYVAVSDPLMVFTQHGSTPSTDTQLYTARRRCRCRRTDHRRSSCCWP